MINCESRRNSKLFVPLANSLLISSSLRRPLATGGDESNKAGYTAQDAPSTRLEITRDLRTYGRTDGPTDGRTHPLIEMRRRI